MTTTQEILARNEAKSFGVDPDEWRDFTLGADTIIQALSDAGLMVVEKPKPKPSWAWFMFDNHTFCELSGMSIEQAMEEVERCTERDKGYGFVSVEVGGDKETFQWHPDDAWRERVRDMLSRLPATPQDGRQDDAPESIFTGYGFCPVCTKPGQVRERRINGNDTCVNGHVYPSAKAIADPSRKDTDK